MTFSQLAIYFQKLEETASRITMTEILAEVFGHALKGEIGHLCYLLQGRVAPLYEPVEFGIADKLMIRVIAHAYGVDEGIVLTTFKKAGDLGIAAQQCYTHGKDTALSVNDVYDQLVIIAKTSGEGSVDKKIALLSHLLTSVDALSARYIARIPLDKLRLGFSDMTILDALSWMLIGDKSLHNRLEDAYNVDPDIGLVAEQVKQHGIDGIRHMKIHVGAPIMPSLCQRLPTADEMIEKMTEVSVEPKYDGVRVQIHFKKIKGKNPIVTTYSRNLENTSEMFPELSQMAKYIDADEVILDSEAVGIDPKTSKIMPFQETTTRKRKYDIQLALESVPLRFYIFDILYKDGKDLLSSPLSTRREILDKTLIKNDLLSLAPHIVTTDPVVVHTYHTKQLSDGLEGIVVKKWNSPYEPGRRGYSWVKLKEAEGQDGKLTDTIDAVVMGYYKGEGKRTDFGIGALLVGVKKDDTFVTLTKIGTGVTDELWKVLKKQLFPLQSENQPHQYEKIDKTLTPDVWVTPHVVLEIAGDDLTKSPTHGSIYALRFPRLVKIRTDKSAQQVTTVKEIDTMYHQQQSMNKR